MFEADGTTPTDDQHVVKPNQIAKFEFMFTAPSSLLPGTYREWFQPVLEGGNPWDMGASAFLDVKVRAVTHKAKYRGQSPYPSLPSGQQAAAFFLFENTGTATWLDARQTRRAIAPLVLATTGPINRISRFNDQFDTVNRPSIMFSKVYENDGVTLSSNQDKVTPGQVARYDFTLTAPADISPGTYREWFQPVLEGAPSWDIDGYVFLDVRIKP